MLQLASGECWRGSPVQRKLQMRRLVLVAVICLVGCKSPPPSDPNAAVRVDAPGVSVRVQDDGGVKVYDPSGRSGVPTVVVPGR